MNLSGLRTRLAHLAGATAPPETGIAPHLLADLKRHWKAHWPQQTEADWPRHLRTIDRIMHMNSEQRAALLAELGAKLNPHTEVT
jgi:hypothetical protein